MGNVLRCFGREDDHGGGHHYPYYSPTSRPRPYPYYSHHHHPGLDQQAPGRPHGVTAATAPDQYILNFKSTSMDTTVPNEVVVAPQNQDQRKVRTTSSSTEAAEEDIDEWSAKELRDAESYARANAMLIQVSPVPGTTKTFWRLSDEATRISRKLALILRNHHAAGKYLAAPLRVSNVWVSGGGGSGSVVVKLRGVRFREKENRRLSRLRHLRDDYRDLSRVLHSLIRVSDGDVGDGVARLLPPDYREFLALLLSDTLTAEDEFLIVNNPALLPMPNRTEVFLMLYDVIKHLGRTKEGRAKKKRILAKLPYKEDWLDTAVANEQINKWVENVRNKPYQRTQLDLLRLNRNVRSHLRDYNDDNVEVEETLYCEWPMLLPHMVRLLHAEGELQGTRIHNKFG